MDVFAFLADRLSAARVDVHHDYGPAAFKNDMRGTATVGGEIVPFVIITHPDRLRGMSLSGFAFVRSADGMSGHRRAEMQMIAQSRLTVAKPEPAPPA